MPWLYSDVTRMNPSAASTSALHRRVCSRVRGPAWAAAAVLPARRVDGDWHVARLGVAPDLRGRRLGRWLLCFAEEARPPDCRRIVLFTGSRSLANTRRYRAAGYRQVAGDHGTGTVCLSKGAHRRDRRG